MKPIFILLPTLAFAMSAHAQMLAVTSSAGGDSTMPEIIVSLTAAPKRAPVALQFDIHISARHFSLDRWTYSAGSAAQSAGKTVQCAGRWAAKTAGMYVYSCIISGGGAEILDGPVLRATVARSTIGGRSNSGKVTIENAQAVDAELRPYSIRKNEWVYR